MSPALKRLLLWAASVLIAVFQGVNVLSIGMPIWARYRWGLGDGLLSFSGLAVGLVLAFVLFRGEYSGIELALNLPFLAGLIAFLVPWPSGIPERTLYRVLLATALASVAFFPAGAWIFEQQAFTDWAQRMFTQAGLLPLGDQEGVNAELLRTTLLNALSVLRSIYAALTLVFFTLVTGLAQRLALPPHRWPLLARFSLPPTFVYGYILGLAALSWLYLRHAQDEMALWEMVWINLGAVFVVLYTLEGLGVFYAVALLRGGRLGTGLVNIALSLLLILTVNPGLWQYLQIAVLAVSALGASKIWVDYRKLFQPIEKESS